MKILKELREDMNSNADTLRKELENISWEGGTTEKFNLYRKETYSVREGFTTRTEERIYNYPNATFKSGSGDTSGCTINNTPN